MGGTISSIALVLSAIESSKPGNKPSVRRSGGMTSRGALELFYCNALRASVAKRSHLMHLCEFPKPCYGGVIVDNKYTQL